MRHMRLSSCSPSLVLALLALAVGSLLSACGPDQRAAPAAGVAASPAASQAAAGSPVASAPTPSIPVPTAAPTGTPDPACQIVFGFAEMRDRVGAAVVGACHENERPIPGNGNIEQRTANGMLVFRALDQRLLFVGASQTWINRDGALVTRPNEQRLEWEGDRQLVEALRRGGHTLYFRHGPTDPNQRDTEPTNLANCATQRNLTEAGRQQARATGAALRALNVPAGQLLTSEYCRAKEYALLLFGREAAIEPSLVLPDPLTEPERAQNTEALKAVLARPPQAGTNTLMVSHSPNIRAAAGADLPVEGGAAVLRLEQGVPTVVARVLPEEWTIWARVLGAR